MMRYVMARRDLSQSPRDLEPYTAPEVEVLVFRGMSILDDLSLDASFEEFIEGEEL